MAIRALGFEVKKTDVQKIMRDYDREEKGKITFQDFSEVSKCAGIICFFKGELVLFLYPLWLEDWPLWEPAPKLCLFS